VEAKSERAPIKKNSGTLKVTTPSDREVAMTRVFDAPRHLVFKAWTTPEHMMRWWGPQGFTCLSCAIDLRVGGTWRLAMRSPAGVEDRQRGVFREIVEPERIVFTYAFEDFAERGRARTAGLLRPFLRQTSFQRIH